MKQKNFIEIGKMQKPKPLKVTGDDAMKENSKFVIHKIYSIIYWKIFEMFKNIILN